MNEDQKKINRLLKTSRGQIDGILAMIEDQRYCIDISNQIMASIAILKKVNTMIIQNHLESCVLNAQDDLEEKLDEIKMLLEKMSK